MGKNGNKEKVCKTETWQSGGKKKRIEGKNTAINRKKKSKTSEAETHKYWQKTDK